LRRLISASQYSFLLSRLEPDVLARLAPNLSVVDLEQNEVLAETHQRIQKVYFPHTGIISCVVELVGGGAIETRMIGKDGEFDASQALDDKVSLNHIVIQVPGTASVIDSDCIKEMAHETRLSRPAGQVRAVLSLTGAADGSLQRRPHCSSPYLQVAPANARVRRVRSPANAGFSSANDGGAAYQRDGIPETETLSDWMLCL
jgi:hypothetical protein